MFKKVICVLCIICLSLLTFTACSDEKEFDEDAFFDDSKFQLTETKDNFTYDVYENYVEIIAYDGNESILNIPGEINGKTVMSVGETAFENNEKLNEVIFPDSLLRIDEYAFCGCVNLTKVKLNKGLKIIGEKAFYSDAGLTQIEIPKSVRSIGCLAFSECEKLSKVEIPDTVKHIGGAAFMFTPWLDEIKDEFVIVGDQVLIDYKGNKSDVAVPDGVKTVSAFSNRYGLDSVKLPASVERIGSMGFAYCNSLKEIVIPDNVREIGDRAFMWCQSLKKVTMSKSVQKLGDYVFSDCSVLENMDFPATLKKLGERVFIRCAKLQSVTVRSNDVEAGDAILDDASKNVTIIANANSSIKDYAKKYEYAFKNLSEK